MNIRKLILGGEGVSLDFKKTITSCEKIAKTLTAFANNKGGRLLIGILDDGSIIGVKAEEEEKYMLLKAAQSYCRPTIDLLFEEVYIDDKTVLVAEVKESDTKPHFALGEDKRWWVYVRVNDKSLLASKIVVDVLKKGNGPEGVLIQYGADEKKLLEYLHSHHRITSSEYSRIMKLPRRKSNRILVNLVLSGVIRLHTTEKEEYYTAS
jgi:predicted HTH transcriptional regulator